MEVVKRSAAQQKRSLNEDSRDGTPAKVQSSGPSRPVEAPVQTAQAVITLPEASAVQWPVPSGTPVEGGSLPTPAPSSSWHCDSREKPIGTSVERTGSSFQSSAPSRSKSSTAGAKVKVPVKFSPTRRGSPAIIGAVGSGKALSKSLPKNHSKSIHILPSPGSSQYVYACWRLW